MTVASSPDCGRAHTTREFGNNSECCKCDSGLLVTEVPVATGDRSAVAAELVTLATPNVSPPPTPGVISETQSLMQQGHMPSLWLASWCPWPITIATLASAKHWQIWKHTSDKEHTCDTSGRSSGKEKVLALKYNQSAQIRKTRKTKLCYITTC